MRTFFSFFFCLAVLGVTLQGQCEDLLITGQSQLDTFACDTVFGNFIISDDNDGVDDITSLVPLRTAGLIHIDRSIIVKNCNSLTTLEGLNSITTVGTKFEVVSNDHLQAVGESGEEPFSLRKVGFDVTFDSCPRLKAINRLELLDSVGFAIILRNLDSLQEVEGFNGLTELQELRIERNIQYKGPLRLRSLEEITDSLIITDNPNLTECCWVSELTSFTPSDGVVLKNNGEGCSNINSIQGSPPIFANCPDNIEVSNISGQCFAFVSLINPEVLDGCGLSSYTLSIRNENGENEVLDVIGLSTALDSLAIGVNRLSFEVKDFASQSDECEFVVNVQDVESPTFSMELENDTLGLIGTSCMARYSLEFPQVLDNCDMISGRLSIVRTANNDTVFSSEAMSGVNYQIDLGAGDYEVIASATDISGLKDRSSANINVPDDGIPQLINCPADVSVSLGDDCIASVTLSAPGIIGTCSEVTLLQEVVSEHGNILDSGVVMPDAVLIDTFPVGISSVIFRIVDLNASCSTTVVVDGGLDLEVQLDAEDIDCTGGSGTISAQLDTTGLSILWRGPGAFNSTSLTNEVQVPGVYLLQVTDSEGCEQIFSLEVFQGGGEFEVNVARGPINCEMGERQIRVEEEFSADVDYRWTGPDSFYSEERSPFIRLGGWYYVEVEGDFGCIGRDSIFIEHNIFYTFELMVMSDSASVEVSGGTPPFLFSWDNGAMGTSTSGLEIGDHILRIVDGLGCARDIEFSVITSSMDTHFEKNVSVRPNPFVLDFQLMSDIGMAYEIYDMTGVKVSGGVTSDEVESLGIELKPGVYYLLLESGEVHKLLKI